VTADTGTIAQDLGVFRAWIRQSPPGVPAAGYLVVRNSGVTARTIIGAASNRAARVELHRSSDDNGVARMEPVGRIEVPAGGEAVFAPGGLHLMLMGVEPLELGSEVEIRLLVDRGPPLQARAVVRRRSYTD